MTSPNRAASLRSSIAALERWSRVADPSAETAPARAGLEERLRRQADPDANLSPQELSKQLKRIRTLHFRRLAYLRWHGKKAKGAGDA